MKYYPTQVAGCAVRGLPELLHSHGRFIRTDDCFETAKAVAGTGGTLLELYVLTFPAFPPVIAIAPRHRVGLSLW